MINDKVAVAASMRGQTSLALMCAGALLTVVHGMSPSAFSPGLSFPGLVLSCGHACSRVAAAGFFTLKPPANRSRAGE